MLEQPPLDYTCSKVGPDRLLFGTDTGCPFPIFTKVGLQLKMVNNLKISEADKQKILGGNATKLLKI
ncbi:MAG: amidohydrolase family protein [Thaumarchaeota archaeon]|nr:amidohydrolase family protein [Nitrososphaerota archaeon]